jgi:SAM-dependent methyltransferase
MDSVRDFEHRGWQQAAPIYAASFARITSLFVDALLDAAGVGADMTVLDIACGPGHVSATARMRGAHVTGIDFSAAMIAEARRNPPGIAFEEADAERLPFADESFDAAVANFGLHHVENPERALREIHRVLRPGGGFAFTLWAKPPENAPWRVLIDAITAVGDTRVLAPSPNEARIQRDALVRTAAAAGFAPASIREREIDRVWHLPAGFDLVGLFETSTVRLAALLQRQTPAAREAIRAHVRSALAHFTEAGTIALPTRAIVIAARKLSSG